MVIRLWTKLIFSIIPMAMVDISPGESINRLTNIFDRNIFFTDTGKLFVIHRFCPSIDMEAIVVQEVDIQNVIITGMISSTAPATSMPSTMVLGSINGKAITIITNISIPNTVFIT